MTLSDEPSLFITGGAGFVGSNFVRASLAAGGRVLNYDKLTYAGNLASLADLAGDPRYRFAQGDIGDGRRVLELLSSFRPSAIVHLAAESHVDRSIDAPAPFVMTNVVGTCQLLCAAREYWKGLDPTSRERFRFLHFTTDEVYGSLGPSGSSREEDPFAPTSAYAASKAAGDHLAMAEFRTHGLPVVLLRATNLYGPYQYPEKLIPLMIQAALAGRPLPIYGDGQQVRSWLHIEDACRGIEITLRDGRPGEEYHIGSSEERRNLEVVEQICAIVDQLRPDLPHSPCRRWITHVEDRPGHDRRYSLDSAKLRRELGWQPRWTFARGLEQTVTWYLANAAWVEQVTRGKYQGERMGLG